MEIHITFAQEILSLYFQFWHIYYYLEIMKYLHCCQRTVDEDVRIFMTRLSILWIFLQNSPTHTFFKEIHKTFVHKYVHKVLCLHNQSCDSLPVRPTNRLTGVGHIRLPIHGFGLDLLSGTDVATILVSLLIWWFVPISAGCLIAKLRYHVLLSTELRLGLLSFTATPLYD